MEKVNIFLADHQILFREGMHFTLAGEEDFEVIGEAISNKEALNFITKNPPKVAIFNVNHDTPSGIDITRYIRQYLPSVATILVMDSYNTGQLFSAMKSGASACLSKDINPEELIQTTRKVACGEYPIRQSLLTSEIASLVIDEFKTFSLINKKVGELLAHLLPLEAQILDYVAGGSPIGQITWSLGIQEKVISPQLDLILSKLIANDRTRGVIEAAQSKLTVKVSRARPAGT
ncbi:MAG: response regulator transcription factor [Chloroflexi bacterium]|nr:response regulator transcription factor [Chloroflexota bacterium]